MRKLRNKEIKSHAPGHITSKWQTRVLCSLGFPSLCFKTSLVPMPSSSSDLPSVICFPLETACGEESTYASTHWHSGLYISVSLGSGPSSSANKIQLLSLHGWRPDPGAGWISTWAHAEAAQWGWQPAPSLAHRLAWSSYKKSSLLRYTFMHLLFVSQALQFLLVFLCIY